MHVRAFVGYINDLFARDVSDYRSDTHTQTHKHRAGNVQNARTARTHAIIIIMSEEEGTKTKRASRERLHSSHSCASR